MAQYEYAPAKAQGLTGEDIATDVITGANNVDEALGVLDDAIATNNDHIATLTEFQKNDIYSLTGLYAIAKSNSGGTSLKALFPTPKGIKSSMTLSNNLSITALRKYDGTSASSGASISSVTRENYGNLAVSISGSFTGHNLYYIELSGDVTFS